MRPLKPILSLLAVLLSSNACVTSNSRRPPAPAAQTPIEKEGQKIPDQGAGANGVEAPAAPAMSATDQTALWNRIQNLQEPLSEDDIRQATQLYPAPKASLEEAIFVTTQLRMLLRDWERRTAFQTQDLHTNQTADRTGGLSLEGRFQDVEIDLVEALRNNPALKNRSSLALAKHLATNTRNAEAFQATVLAVVAEQGQAFGDLNLPAAVPATAGEATLPSASPEEATPSPSVEGATEAPLGESAVDLMGSDALLLDSQKLADKGDFKAAIAHVNRIKAEDPYFAQAQEKKKQYSNRAVKGLRQRAAEAFSNSIPLSDSAAKISYLRQAKNYLEEALRDYPQADQLDTVKENLEAVNRDLSSLDKTGT